VKKKAPSGAFLLPEHNEGMKSNPIKLPKKPRIEQASPLPDQRKFIVLPFRAATDYALTPMQLRVLLVLCSYCNRAGVAWVGSAKIAELLQREASNIGRHLQNLERKGYLRVVCKGFKGQRAHTRQVLFDKTITADDAAAISGEAAPYQQREALSNNPGSFDTERHVMARKRKVTATTDAGNLKLDDEVMTSLDLNSVNQWHELERAVGADMLALARSKSGGDAATVEQVHQVLNLLLR
jgi:hypothetical protein